MASGGRGGTSVVSPPKKAAITYETYHRTTLRSPGSSETSSFRDDQESIATQSTGVCSEEDDASLDRIDEGTGLVPKPDAAPREQAGLSYNFNESSSSNLSVTASTVVATTAAIPPPTRTSDNVAPPTPPVTPMQ